MAAPRNAFEREQERATVASMKARGYSQAEIARHLERPEATISRDVQAIMGQFRKEVLDNVSEIVADQLLELLEVRREAWREWERSKDDATRTVTERTNNAPVLSSEKGDGPAKVDGKPVTVSQKARVETEGRLGDPRYLQVVISVQERAAKLLGLDAADRVERGTDADDSAQEARRAFVGKLIGNPELRDLAMSLTTTMALSATDREMDA